MIQPRDLGAPDKFSLFRHQQGRAFNSLVNSTKRIDVIAAPVGVGKSLIGVSYAKLMGMRSVINTSTRGLQDQYKRDYSGWGVEDVRGMSNYPCRLLDTGDPVVPGCDQGPCLDGESCVWRDGGCSYYDAWRGAREQDIVVTNYPAWFSHDPATRKYSLGPRDLVIADEAHELSQIITSAVGVSFTGKEVKRLHGMDLWTVDQWREWGKARAVEADALLKSEKLSRSEKRKLRAIAEKFNRLADAGGDWAHTWTSYGPRWEVQLEPISPAPYVESWLWRGAQKVVLLSGTIRPAHLAELGYQPSEYNFFETPSPFPASDRPIYRVSLGFRLNAKTSEINLQAWVGKMDQIIRSRQDRKGIIHTVSYSRAEFIKGYSKYGPKMLLHDSQNTREVVEEFKQAPPGMILVSPSVHTGWDFPYEQAEYQIVSKVPFPNTQTGLARARKEHDEHWDTRHAVATLVQSTGRIVRGDGDFGETFIVDDTMNYLWGRHREHFPVWFQQAYRQVESVPGAPPRRFE